MISQAVQNIPNTSAFNDFAQYRRDRNFFVTQKYEPPKKEKSHKYISVIAISALAAGFAVFAFMNGPKGISKSLDKIKNHLEKKIANNPASPLSKVYLSALQKVNSFIAKSEAINNFTSIKDIMFKKLMGKRKWSAKLHDQITNLFERVGRETVLTSWHNTKHSLNKTFKNLDKTDNKLLQQNSGKLITINGETKTLTEWVKILKSGREEITEIIASNTTQKKLGTRYRRIKKAVLELDETTFQKIKKWKEKDLYQTFIADKAVTKDKTALFEEMQSLRQQIGFNREDKLKLAEELIKEAEILVNPKDLTTTLQISMLKSDLQNGALAVQLTQRIKNLAKVLIDKKESSEQVTALLNKTQSLIENNQKGKIEELLEIYKHLLPEKEFLKVQEQTEKLMKSIDSSINIETVQFFDKSRDLKVGSAPTDVLSIVTSLGLIGAGLLKAENKDERISVTLKAGIPVLGAMATSLFCTARLISGGKAMSVGLLSGWLLNKAGAYTDNIRKKLQAAESGTNAL